MTNTPELLNPAAVAAELIGAPAGSDPAAPVTVQAPQTAPAVMPERVASIDADAGNVTPTPDGMMDKAGRVFDAARYKSLPDGKPFRNRLGYFMPKGGRRAGSAASAPAASADAAPAAAPATPPPAFTGPEVPAWSEAEKAAAAKPAAEAAAPGLGTVPADAEPVIDHSNDAAEAICGGVYLVADYALDTDGESQPGRTEHENLSRATAAWIRSTGWKGGPLAGMLLGWAAYLMRLSRKPKASAKIRGWFGEMKRAEPAVDVKATPVPPPAEPAPETPRRAAAPTGSPVGFGNLRQG